MHTFVPSGQQEPHRSMFSTQKRWGGEGPFALCITRCHIGSLIWRYQKLYFLPAPQNNGFWAQKRPNLVQHWHFWSNIGLFVPLGPMTKRGAQVVFLYVSTKTFASLCKNYGFWPKNGRIWLKIPLQNLYLFQNTGLTPPLLKNV